MPTEGGETLAKAREALIQRTPRSREAAARAQEVLPVEIAGTIEMPYTIYIESCQGARMTDIDGNTYIDLTMGAGPHVLGHAPAVVREALKRQLDRGWHFGIHNAMQERLARLIVEASRCAESVMFCNSGTEATMYAIRIARAFTGKTNVAVFEGSYHGSHDYALVYADRRTPRSEPGRWLRGKGIPAPTAESGRLKLISSETRRSVPKNRAALLIHEHDLYSARALRESNARLNELGLGTQITTQPSTKPDEINVRVTIVEKSRV